MYFVHMQYNYSSTKRHARYHKALPPFQHWNAGNEGMVHLILDSNIESDHIPAFNTAYCQALTMFSV